MAEDTELPDMPLAFCVASDCQPSFRLCPLPFSCEGPMVRSMSTKAQAILEEIKALPPEEQEQVRDGILQLDERRRQWEEQKTKLREKQSRHTGRGLLNRLLEERAKERARG